MDKNIEAQESDLPKVMQVEGRKTGTWTWADWLQRMFLTTVVKYFVLALYWWVCDPS